MKFKKLVPEAILPTRGTTYSAGLDLYASVEYIVNGCVTNSVTVPARSSAVINTGIACAIPEGYAGFVYARSGLACKQGIKPRNCVGVVDADYRGEIKVCLYNDSNTDYVVNHGERVAQLVIAPVSMTNVEECDELPETERGDGGFGSTGK